MRKLRELAVAHVMGGPLASDLIEAAQDALGRDLDSPALIQLACSDPDETFECCSVLFKKALEELGVEYPSRQEALRLRAAQIAQDVLENRISSYQGARAIWKEITWELEEDIVDKSEEDMADGSDEDIDPLFLCIGIASEIEDILEEPGEAFEPGATAYQLYDAKLKELASQIYARFAERPNKRPESGEMELQLKYINRL